MRKHRADLSIILIILALMAASLIIVYAIGPRVASALNAQYGRSFGSGYFFQHHLLSIVLSIGAIVAGYLIKHEKIAKYAKALMIVSIVLCLCVTIFGVLGIDALVTCDKGACRSLRLGSFGFMPSELFKVAVLFYIPWLINDRKKSGELNTKKFFVPLATIFLAVVVLLAWWEKDFGSTVVITTMVFAMMWIGGVELKTLGKMLGILAIVAAILIVFFPHRIQRLMSFDGDGDDYHIKSAMISIATGSITGVGLGNSIQATGYLPEALSDSIFAIVCETWGAIGGALVVLAFAVLSLKLIKVSQHTENGEMRLLVIGVFAWILSHVIINIGGMTGLIPMKGITLPFLSQGGTSMIFVAYAVGVVLQISGWTTREIAKDHEDSSSRRGQRGTCYASRSGRS